MVLRWAPEVPRVLVGEEPAEGPSPGARRAGTGTEEALPLADTFPWVRWSQAGPAHPFMNRQRCHHPHFMGQEAEAQRDLIVHDSGKEMAEQRLPWTLTGCFSPAGAGSSGPNKASQAGKFAQSAI